MPVHDRVVDAELQTFRLARIGQRLYQIFAAGGERDIPIIVHFRRPQAEAIVMFRGDANVFDPGGFHQAHPVARIILRWIPRLHERAVLGAGNFQVVLNPLRAAGDGLALPFAGELRVQSPVNEHPKLRVPKPLHPRVVCRDGFLVRSNWGVRSFGGGRGMYAHHG